MKLLKISFISTIFILTLSFIGAANADAQIPEILKRMDDHQRKLTSLRADVMMDKSNSQLGDHDVYEGKAIYRKVGEKDAWVRIDWSKPDQEALSVQDRKYVLYKPRIAQAFTGNVDEAQKKNTQGVGSFDFLKMSNEQLKANYSVKYWGEEQVAGAIPTWHLELTPRAAKSYKSVDLWVDGNGMVLQTRINYANSDATTLLLSNLKKNTEIGKNEFQVKLPSGTKIIKP